MSSNPSVKPVRVRFAPSPTGYLHIGGLRTALYNWLLARKEGGTFILRIEDTDQSRYVADAETDILESLRWAGLDIDEGPEQGGLHAPYHQSQRSERYRRYAEQLIDQGHAYYAFDKPEEIELMRERMTASGQAAAYDTNSRGSMLNSLTLAPEDVARRLEEGSEYVVRLKIPENRTVEFTDLIRGSVSFASDVLDDQVLLKSDGLPTYHLANVVDDHEMGVTHVIRGEEWLPSTPKHIVLYECFGWMPPQMAHLPLILSPSGGKLSKRSAERAGIPVSVKEYIDLGYEPEALLNFLAFLGWNPGTEQEVFSLEELVDVYSIERTGQHGVQFNLEKLNWFNGQHLRRKSVEELAEAAEPLFESAGLAVSPETLKGVVELLRERISFLSELPDQAKTFLLDPMEYDPAGVKKRWKEDSAELIRTYAARLEALASFSAESAESALQEILEEREIGTGRLIAPVRLAVSGTMSGPGLFAMLEVIGKEATIRRLRKAAEVLG